MEILKPIVPASVHALISAAAILISATVNAQPGKATGLLQQETQRRNESVQEARELLRKGDESYQAGRFADAVEAYAGAREMIPNAPASAELHQAATLRYAQASVELARGLSKQGDPAKAKAAIDQVLKIAPSDPGALAMRAQLDDPIRTNPAATAEHAKNVDQVRRLLYTAQGAFDLGKFDEAASTYNDALRIDPTNTAARRGLEKVANAKSGYFGSAYDHTRAEMLSEVEAGWETRLGETGIGLPAELGPSVESAPTSISLRARLDQIIIPKIALHQATLDEAIEFLRVAANQAPGAEPINITSNFANAPEETAKRIRSQRFDLQVSQVPLSQALSYINDLTRTIYTTDDYAVIIAPLGTASGELITRSYRVPADFLTGLSNSATGGEAEEEDPFASETTERQGLLTRRLSAQEALTQNGISFPDGASAHYNPSTHTLLVINTATAHDMISQVVERMSQAEPVTVAVRVTLIRTQQSNLKELGYDWLITPFNVGGDTFATGGTAGNTPGRYGSDFVNPVQGNLVEGVPTLPGAVATGVVTNGLRSGSQGIRPDAIDELLLNRDRLAQTISVAPGVMSLTGFFTDGQVQMMMRGLDQKTGVDIMAKPAVLTRSGQASNVAITREFMYPSEYEPPELPNSVDQGSMPVTPAMPSSFETKALGMILEVLPVADANRQYIDVTLNPSFSEFDGFVNYGSPINATVDSLLGTETVPVTSNSILMPVFSTQRASSQITVRDGVTVAFGGLLSEKIQQVEDKVPVLGDLPMVGRFFTTTAHMPVSTAVIFLVQVELLDPTGRPYRDR